MQAFSDGCYGLPPVQPETDPALQDREPLVDGRVDVLPGHGPARPHEKLRHQQFAAGVLGADADHHPLAGNRVLRLVPRSRHPASSVGAYRRAEVPSAAGRRIPQKDDFPCSDRVFVAGPEAPKKL